VRRPLLVPASSTPAAEELDADLIVIGHSGHSGVWGLFLGTTAEKVSRHAPCSILIVR
jgi:nucleotide-binding universal stress UspA family protein